MCRNIQVVEIQMEGSANYNSSDDKVSVRYKMERMLIGRTHMIAIGLSLVSLLVSVIAIVIASVMVTSMKDEIEQLQNRNSYVPGSAPLVQHTQGDTEKQYASGATYIRWGKHSCPHGAELIYKGMTTGSSTASTNLPGGGSNLLCLHQEPEWNKYGPDDGLGYSWLYPAEFLPAEVYVDLFEKNVSSHSVACSTCLTPRTATVTISGRKSCPQDWTAEYTGYLMSSHVTQSRTSFICVDSNPDVMEGTGELSGGSMLFFVSAYCNGQADLECPPYVHGREIPCVVCSK